MTVPTESPAQAPPTTAPPAATAVPEKPAEGSTVAETTTPTAETAPAAPAAGEGVWYLIRRGDTLWDISATYYRNPWFYPRIARHPRNDIENPDLILAGLKLFISRN